MASSCKQTSEKKSISKTLIENKVDIPEESVTLSIKSNSYRLSEIPDVLNVKFTNNTKDTLLTGLRFRIDKFQNNEWNEISPKDLFFNDIGIELKHFATRDLETPLLKEYIKYDSGEFRIAKYYLKSNFIITKMRYYVYAEFSIE